MCLGLVDVGRSCCNLRWEKVEFEMVRYNGLCGPVLRFGTGDCN